MGRRKTSTAILKRRCFLFSGKPREEYNYKQIAAVLELRDTRGRNELIKFLNLNVASQQLKIPSRGKYTLAANKKQYYQGRLNYFFWSWVCYL